MMCTGGMPDAEVCYIVMDALDGRHGALVANAGKARPVRAAKAFDSLESGQECPHQPPKRFNR